MKIFLQIYKIMQLAAHNAYETTHYNITGILPNPVIKFTH